MGTSSGKERFRVQLIQGLIAVNTEDTGKHREEKRISDNDAAMRSEREDPTTAGATNKSPTQANEA
jgi:hypothetical protein